MQRKWSLWILVLSQAFVFAWFGIDKFIHPLLWMDFLPDWMSGLLGMSKQTWLSVLGVLEIIMALLVVTPVRRVRQLGASLMSLHLLGIVWDIGLTDVGVRDVGLLGAALALALFP